MLATLCSAISARVVKGELLRLCPGSSGRAPQYRKPKTDCHDAARAGQLFERFQILKDFFYFIPRNRSLSDLGVYSAPSSAFRIPGAMAKFKIIELLWLSEGDKDV